MAYKFVIKREGRHMGFTVQRYSYQEQWQVLAVCVGKFYLWTTKEESNFTVQAVQQQEKCLGDIGFNISSISGD